MEQVLEIRTFLFGCGGGDMQKNSLFSKIKWFFLFIFSVSVYAQIPVTSNEDVIIAFSVDDNYATFIPVTIESIKDYASPKRKYKIFILGNNISANHAHAIFQTQTENVTTQIIDIKDLILKENIGSLKTLEHINTATYYRFFIPEVLQDYKKAVYLEADQILQADVAELYDTDLQGKSLGIAPQIKFSVTRSKEWFDYVQKTLKMVKPNNYFNAGVLVMNLEKLRENDFRNKALKLAENNNFKYLDQDILNSMFSDDCVRVEKEWNMEIFILDLVRREYKPKLIHYTVGNLKPWRNSRPDEHTFRYSDLFWDYAKKTANYDEILQFAPKQ